MTKLDFLEGIIVPIATPVTAKEDLDEAGLRRLVRHVVDNGVDGVFALGSTGNFCAFDSQEKQRILEVIVDEVSGEIPVLSGATDISVRRAVDNAIVASKAGADLIVLSPPFYWPLSLEEVVVHFREVVRRIGAPVAIYNNPFASNIHVDAATMRRMVDEETIVAIKESSGDFGNFQKLLAMRRHGLPKVLQGLEGHAGPSLLLGADGAILALANVAPRLCREMYDVSRTGDISKTIQLAAQMNDLFDAVTSPRRSSMAHSFFAGLEACLRNLGICTKVCTLPYESATTDETRRIRDLLTERGVACD